jgi:hypothetical protein
MRGLVGLFFPFLFSWLLAATFGFRVSNDAVFLASCFLLGFAAAAEEIRTARKEKK